MNEVSEEQHFINDKYMTVWMFDFHGIFLWTMVMYMIGFYFLT